MTTAAASETGDDKDSAAAHVSFERKIEEREEHGGTEGEGDTATAATAAANVITVVLAGREEGAIGPVVVDRSGVQTSERCVDSKEGLQLLDRVGVDCDAEGSEEKVLE